MLNCSLRDGKAVSPGRRTGVLSVNADDDPRLYPRRACCAHSCLGGGEHGQVMASFLSPRRSQCRGLPADQRCRAPTGAAAGRPARQSAHRLALRRHRLRPGDRPGQLGTLRRTERWWAGWPPTPARWPRRSASAPGCGCWPTGVSAPIGWSDCDPGAVGGDGGDRLHDRAVGGARPHGRSGPISSLDRLTVSALLRGHLPGAGPRGRRLAGRALAEPLHWAAVITVIGLSAAVGAGRALGRPLTDGLPGWAADLPRAVAGGPAGAAGVGGGAAGDRRWSATSTR